MKRNLIQDAGKILLISAGLLSIYTFLIFQNSLPKNQLANIVIAPGVDPALFTAFYQYSGLVSLNTISIRTEETLLYINYGYIWIIALMLILGIVYLIKKESPRLKAGAVVHGFFGILIGLYALSMLLYPHDTIYELIIVVNSWFLLVSGIIALLFRPKETHTLPLSILGSMFLTLPLIAVFISLLNLGPDGGIVKFGQWVLCLLLILPFYVCMRWMWKKWTI